MGQKKAEIGIGTLIIFIAMILVAAIAAGVLLQTASSLQNKALLTGEKSKQQVSTSLNVLQVYAEDGDDGNAELFCETVKLQPGSDPIKIGDLLMNFDTKDTSSEYLQGNKTTGTLSWSIIYSQAVDNQSSEILSNTDFDGDGTLDYIALLQDVSADASVLVVEVSNGSNPKENVTVALGVNLTEAGFNYSSSGFINVSTYQVDINDSASSQWGSISVTAWDLSNSSGGITTTNGYVISAGNYGNGAYYVTYLVQGASYISNYLNRGDVIKVCEAAPRAITEDEDISITLVPKVGATSTVETSMPEIFSQKRVYIYP